MGRPRKQAREPFWFADRNAWYVTVGAKKHRLSPDRDEAWRLWHEIMAKPPERRQAAAPVAFGPVAAVALIDLFLEWTQVNRARRTYDAYLAHLQQFAEALPKGLAAVDVRPFHVTRVMDAGGWSNNTKNDFATVVQRAFNWAEAQGLIDRNPVRKVEKPAREARELAIRPIDYAEVMAAVKEPNFRDLLRFSWETGVRPQEVRAIEARHVDLAARRITFPPKESKGKKRHRVVYLTDAAASLLEPLIAARPDGPLFLNSEDAPWNKNAINCAFCRLKKKIGRKLHLGAWRKGYATEALKAGVDVIGLATLLGHSNSAMLASVYAKVHQDPEYMASIADRARGVKEGGGAST